jgi:hypothetical protein
MELWRFYVVDRRKNSTFISFGSQHAVHVPTRRCLYIFLLTCFEFNGHIIIATWNRRKPESKCQWTMNIWLNGFADDKGAHFRATSLYDIYRDESQAEISGEWKIRKNLLGDPFTRRWIRFRPHIISDRWRIYLPKARAVFVGLYKTCLPIVRKQKNSEDSGELPLKFSLLGMDRMGS